MIWVAVLPLKGEGERKTRLADILGAPARDRLALTMARHVVSVLTASNLFTRIVLLSPASCDLDGVELVADGGEGLNAELAKMRARVFTTGMCVIHPDLPFLVGDEIAALLNAASTGVAIAPDRREAGTNAVAVSGERPFSFAFGSGSFAVHRASGGAVVKRQGLGFDIDTPDDLAEARARGFTF